MQQVLSKAILFHDEFQSARSSIPYAAYKIEKRYLWINPNSWLIHRLIVFLLFIVERLKKNSVALAVSRDGHDIKLNSPSLQLISALFIFHLNEIEIPSVVVHTAVYHLEISSCLRLINHR